MKKLAKLLAGLLYIFTLGAVIHAGVKGVEYFSNRKVSIDAMAQESPAPKPCKPVVKADGRIGDYRTIVEFQTETCVRCVYVAHNAGSQSNTMSCDFPRQWYPLE